MNYSHIVDSGLLDEDGMMKDNNEVNGLFWLPDIYISNALLSSHEDVLNTFYKFSGYDTFQLFADGRIRQVESEFFILDGPCWQQFNSNKFGKVNLGKLFSFFV